MITIDVILKGSRDLGIKGSVVLALGFLLGSLFFFRFWEYLFLYFFMGGRGVDFL